MFLIGLVVAFVIDFILAGLATWVLGDVFPTLEFWDFFRIVLIAGLVVFVNSALAS